MPNIIPLYRPPLWPRMAIGIAAIGALCLAASVAFASEVAGEKPGKATVVDVIET